MKTRVLWLSVIFTFVFAGTMLAQDVAPENYDRTGITEPGQLAGTSLVQNLDDIKKRAIDNILNRIRKGDPNVLKYVVYDVFQEVHKAILQQSRERTTKSGGTQVVSYYDVVGGKAALPSYYGCFDNQDPKVRLRCIGFLGDWIDDMGIAMSDIGRQAKDRLESNIETRVEVHYGLVLLTLKVLRKLSLNKIWNGDADELRTISPEHFVVLVHQEPFIREMFCVPRDVKLRSIRLLQWWLEFTPSKGGLYWYRSATSEDHERRVSDQYTPFRSLAKDSLGLKIKVNDEGSLIYRNWGGHPAAVIADAPTRKTKGYGYRDAAGYNDIASLYDLRYFRYTNNSQLKAGTGGGYFFNEEKYVPAIFSGLENTSLFVRENVARLLVRLSDGPAGFMDRTGDYSAIKIDAADSSNLVAWDDPTVTSRNAARAATPYELLDDTNSVVGVQGIVSSMAKNAKYQTVLRNAWRDVRFAQFMDVHETNRYPEGATAAGAADPFKTIPMYDINDGINLYRNVQFVSSHNSWGYKYNYRTDIADLMRRFNLGRELEYCEKPRIVAEAYTSVGGHYFVEDLFDLDEQSKPAADGTNVATPLWHGKDEIKDEVFEP